MDSLFPRICAVEAVGMGASSRLFLTPCLRTHRGRYELKKKKGPIYCCWYSWQRTWRFFPWELSNPTNLLGFYPTCHIEGPVAGSEMRMRPSIQRFPGLIRGITISPSPPRWQESQRRFHRAQIQQRAHSWPPGQRNKWSQRSECWAAGPLGFRMGDAWGWTHQPDPAPRFQWACVAGLSVEPVHRQRRA